MCTLSFLFLWLLAMSVRAAEQRRGHPFAPAVRQVSKLKNGHDTEAVLVDSKSPIHRGNTTSKMVSTKGAKTKLKSLLVRAATLSAITHAIAFSILAALVFHVYLYLVENAFWALRIGVPCCVIDVVARDARYRKLKRSIEESKRVMAA